MSKSFGDRAGDMLVGAALTASLGAVALLLRKRKEKGQVRVGHGKGTGRDRGRGKHPRPSVRGMQRARRKEGRG